MIRKAAAVSAFALMLAACGGGEATPEEDGETSAGPQGEVRGGTITDAMLPIAQVQSQAPQRGGGDDSSEEEGEEDDAE